MRTSAAHSLTLSGVLISPLLVALAALTIGLAGWQAFEVVRTADVYDLAASIEGGARPNAAYLAQFADQNGLSRSGLDCDNLASRARLTVLLALAFADDSAADSRAQALANAATAAKDRLRCNPLDGNAWLQLAVVTERMSGASRDAIEDLRLSYVLAPNERWVILPRIDFAVHLAAAGATGLESEFGADLRRFVTFEATDATAKFYVNADPATRARLRPLIEVEPEARRKALINAIDALGVDFHRN